MSKHRQTGPVRPLRVRLEFSAFRQTRPAQTRYRADRMVVLLRVLLTERFGEPGATAYLDWLAQCVAEQENIAALRVVGGGTNEGT